MKKNQSNPQISPRAGAMWYAVYTRSRYEKRVAEQLRDRSIECLLPVLPIIRQWKDRRRTVEMPMFPGYLFVHIPLTNTLTVLSVTGAVRLIGFNNGPVPIRDSQIENLRRLMTEPDRLEPAPYIADGDLVEIIYGPFSGVRGVLLEHHGQRRLSVGIDLIQQAISVEVDKSWVKSLKAPAGHAAW